MLTLLPWRGAAKPDGGDTTTVFPLAFHVATADLPATETKIRQMLEQANQQFAPADIVFEMTLVADLPESFVCMETISERHEVKSKLVKNVINIFVVDEILDATPSKATRKAAAWQNRKPSGRLAGAHIPAPRHTPKTYILIASSAQNSTLAHELGHFFGLPHHRDETNLMSYGSHRQGFNDAQLQTISRTKRQYRQYSSNRTAK